MEPVLKPRLLNHWETVRRKEQKHTMTQNREKIVGILGGMGPEATVDLMQRIIQLTPALDDMDHIRCIVDNNPKVPSRIKAIIEGTGENPGPCMAEMGRRLESWGADFLVIPCNTAHYYHKDVNQAVEIPVIHLIDLVVDVVRQTEHRCRKIGILASPAIKITGLYETRFTPFGIEVIYPDPQPQEELLQVIKSVKKGETGKNIQNSYIRICENLAAKGAETAIVACTELSALRDARLPMKTLNASQILAMEILQVVKQGKQLDKIL